MKCHYTIDDDGSKILIPGCMGTAAMGIEHCTCREEESFAEFENKKYNDTVKSLVNDIKELERENDRLNRLIRKLLKHNYSHD